MKLRVVTLNSFLCRMFGIDLCPQIDTRIELLTKHLRTLRADIICLQEIWSRSILERIAAGLPDYGVLQPPRFPGLKPLGTGLLLATHLPVLQSGYGAVRATFRPKEALASKGVFDTVLDWRGVPLRVANVHLGIGSARALRQHHDGLLRRLDVLGQVHLLCGDFNQAAVPATQRFRPGEIHEEYLADELRARGYQDALVRVHGRAAEQMVTVDSNRNPLLCPGYHLRLDYIWTRSDEALKFDATDARVWLDEPDGGIFVSDHFGLTAAFDVKRAN